MDDSTHPPLADRVVDLLERNARDEIIERLDRMETAPAEDRKALLRSLRTTAGDCPSLLDPILSALGPFLEDDDRSVRLTAAKLFVCVAKSSPEAVVPLVPSLSERLAGESEFYYVRARAAEALGYVALERPEAVASPELLADLRIGLSFDEPEVKEKLAKALECVALGNPRRLRHQIPKLVAHLDDENDLVRDHLYTALVAVGAEFPGRLADAHDGLVDGLDDDVPQVRGRAAEALGLLARSGAEDVPLSETVLRGMQEDDDGDSFVTDRVRFALDADMPDADLDHVGTTRGVRQTTDDAVDAIQSPDADGDYPHRELEDRLIDASDCRVCARFI
ncbi:HEAT repeat domain-containing protein [Salinigranum salinum]|uniref:HEAT repeat domain-containing protein n=1 Tax=Salinigranum salinum TaxID=1364937 RepID=UPI001260BEBD|nr:HEAT repeat domain-containing protein [Salinigranum salinum]